MDKPTLAEMFHSLTTEQPFTPPEHWRQGRTAYGGFSSAMALQIALNHLSQQRPPLKAAQIAFIGPVTEQVSFQVDTLRQGKSATQVAVDARVDDAIVLRAGFTFASPRESSIHHHYVECPQVEPPEHYSSFPKKLPVPNFFKNFDIRLVSQSMFFSGGETPELLAWVRLDGLSKISAEVALLLIGDCLPPASTVCFKSLAPISSMNWTVDFTQPAEHSEWYLVRSFSLVAAGGYSYQSMQVWNKQGELVLSGTQTVAIFA